MKNLEFTYQNWLKGDLKVENFDKFNEEELKQIMIYQKIEIEKEINKTYDDINNSYIIYQMHLRTNFHFLYEIDKLLNWIFDTWGSKEDSLIIKDIINSYSSPFELTGQFIYKVRENSFHLKQLKSNFFQKLKSEKHDGSYRDKINSMVINHFCMYITDPEVSESRKKSSRLNYYILNQAYKKLHEIFSEDIKNEVSHLYSNAKHIDKEFHIRCIDDEESFKINEEARLANETLMRIFKKDNLFYNFLDITIGDYTINNDMYYWKSSKRKLAKVVNRLLKKHWFTGYYKVRLTPKVLAIEFYTFFHIDIPEYPERTWQGNYLASAKDKEYFDKIKSKKDLKDTRKPDRITKR